MDGASISGLLRSVDVVTDLLRVFSLVSVVLAGLYHSWSAVFVFLVVTAVLIVPRAADLPRAVDLAVGVSWLLAGWANVAGWYLKVGWVDIPIHIITPGASAAAIYLLLVRIHLVPPLQQRQVRSAALIVLTFALGAALAVLWEFYEWFRYAGPQGPPVVGYADTVGDLLNGCIGSLIAGIGIAVWARAGWGTRRLPTGRPGRNSDERVGSTPGPRHRT